MKKTVLLFLAVLTALMASGQTEPEYQFTDYHVHLKGDFTYQKAILQSKLVGIRYGIALNCGLGFPTQTDSAARAWLQTMRKSPFLLAMQAEGREWVTLFSPEVRKEFDYVFTDAMTYTDASGKRVRLWIPEEVTVTDEQQFMDDLVSRIETILGTEPIDIYVNPTFLPECIAARYDQLWTRERMLRVIDAAVEHGIAIEINNRYRLPSEKFIRLAKKRGVKFAFGTNNADSNFGNLEYCLEMMRKCGLTDDNMFEVKKLKVK